MVAEGADVIDIGGVWPGPGEEVDATEAQRVVGMIGWIREQYPDISSASTPGGRSGRQGVRRGADLINDTRAGADPELGGGRDHGGGHRVLAHRRRPYAPVRTGSPTTTWWPTCSPR